MTERERETMVTMVFTQRTEKEKRETMVCIEDKIPRGDIDGVGEVK